MVPYKFGTARAYGWLSASSSRLERDIRRRERLLYIGLNEFSLAFHKILFHLMGEENPKISGLKMAKGRFSENFSFRNTLILYRNLL